MRWWAVGATLVVASLVAGTALRASPAQADAPQPALLPTEPGVHAITVGPDAAPGLLGIPSEPSGSLLVLAKAYGTTAAQHEDIARRVALQGHLVLVMEYRGEVADWKVAAGAADVVAGTLEVQRQFDVRHTVLFGISMGGEVSGVALAEAPPGTYDDWVVGAGVMDLAMEWSEAPYFQAAIERETGAAPQLAPEEYAARSPLQRAREIADHGLASIHFIHGLGDTVVPVEHARRMHDSLVGLGAPSHLHELTFTRGTAVCHEGTCLPATVPAGVYNHEAGWSAYAFAMVDRLLATGTAAHEDRTAPVQDLAGTAPVPLDGKGHDRLMAWPAAAAPFMAPGIRP